MRYSADRAGKGSWFTRDNDQIRRVECKTSRGGGGYKASGIIRRVTFGAFIALYSLHCNATDVLQSIQ